jgi:hypothetical protein
MRHKGLVFAFGLWRSPTLVLSDVGIEAVAKSPRVIFKYKRVAEDNWEIEARPFVISQRSQLNR